MEYWHHKKTGGYYTKLGTGKFEAEGETGQEYVMYRSMQDGKVWIRPASEFYDGRFKCIVQPDQGV